MSIFNALLRPVSKMEVEAKKAEMIVPAHNTTSIESAKMDEVTRIFTDDSETEMTVKNYFESKGIEIDLSCSNSDFAPVEELAMLLAMNYDKCKDFYKYLRGVIAKKKFDICYNTYPLSSEERTAADCI